MAQKINQKQYGKKYSTTEQLTGDVWIDGKPIYRKVIQVASLPNNNSYTQPHGISDLGELVDIAGFFTNGSVRFPINMINPISIQNSIGCYISGNNLTIITGNDRTSYYGRVIVEYTKT